MKKLVCLILTMTILVCSFVSYVSAAGLTIVSANYPTSYTEGSFFTVYGTVQSDYTISSVTAGVYDNYGNKQFEYTANPWSTSYNLNNLDDYMTFSKLKAGSYIYKVKASDSYSKDVVLLNKSFTVTSAGNTDAGFKKVNWNIIDLSYWNEIYSWGDIGKSVDGVILRLGYTTTGTHVISYDNMFATWYASAKKQGLHVGCYYFSAALNENEARNEADYVISVLKQNKCQLDMPVYLDMETDEQVALSQNACTKIARAFCDRIKSNGYYAGIYCNKYFARDEIYASQLSDCTFWIAEYNSSCTYNGNYGMWQYSERGTVPGLHNYVDMNYCYYDYPSYIIGKGLNGYTSTPSQPPSQPQTKYTIKEINGVKVNNNSKIVSGVPANLTYNQFWNNYITYSDDVILIFDNTVGGNIATGTTVTFKANNKVLVTYTVSVIGDVDGNSVINSSDALNVLEHGVGKRTLSGVKALSADCTKDGEINSSDALEILETAVR